MPSERFDFSESSSLMDPSGSSSSGWTRKKTLILIAVIVVVGAAVAVGVVLGTKESDDGGVPAAAAAGFAASVRVDDIMVHLHSLNDLAKNYSGSRAVELGYNASVEYVKKTLTAAGYQVVEHYFLVSSFQELGPSALSLEIPSSNTTVNYKYSEDFATMSYSGTGTKTGSLRFIEEDGTRGCQAGDWAGLSGAVVVVPRRNCTFYEKAVHAKTAGVAAILFSNDHEDPTIVNGRAKGDGPGDIVDLPMLGLTGDLGAQLVQLAGSENVSMTVTTNTELKVVTTLSITADSQHGRNDRIIIVGSHLDSVPAGPGINDNGSGSATNLQLALELITSSLKPVNKVRFAWWGAEEIGLVGSTAYVKGLSAAELNNISLNLNYDMLASPNFVRGVYDGQSANTPPNNFGERVANGSARIQEVFEERFEQKKLPYTLSDFNGRSDYGPFIEQQIPAGGLFTGAEVRKTMAQRITFGGLANAQYDPCYHQECDDVLNIDTKVLAEMADAAAYALGVLMMEPDLQGFLHDGPREPNATRHYRW